MEDIKVGPPEETNKGTAEKTKKEPTLADVANELGCRNIRIIKKENSIIVDGKMKGKEINEYMSCMHPQRKRGQIKYCVHDPKWKEGVAACPLTLI